MRHGLVGRVLVSSVVLAIGLTAQHFDPERHRLLPNDGGWPSAFGDFDQDGDIDLVWSGASPGIAWNDGQGRFVRSGQIGVAGVFGMGLIGAVAVGDIDGDGDLDLANPGVFFFGVWLPSRLFRNDGAAGFTDVSTQWTAASEGPLRVLFCDWDGDGDSDLLTCNAWSRGVYESSLAQAVNHIYLNNGAGGFVDSGKWPNVATANTGMAVGDIDGDGDADIVVSIRNEWYIGATSSLTVFVHDAQNVAVAAPGRIPSVPGFSGDYWDVVLSDHDADGDLDLAAASSEGTFLFRNNGAGFFTRYGVVPGAASAIRAADFDGDLRPDLLLYGYNGELGLPALAHSRPSRLLRNTAAGFVDVTATTLEDPDAGPASGFVFDCDGDGDLDVIKGATPQALIWLNDGQGRLLTATRSELTHRMVDTASMADLDGDGDLDVAMIEVSTSSHSELAVAWNDGAGPATRIDLLVPFDWSRRIRGVAFVDPDGDGDLDIYVAVEGLGSASTAQDLLLQNNSGEWKDVTDKLPVALTQTYAVAAGDIDGDGLDDIVAVGLSLAGATAARLYLADGTGGFADASTLLPGTVPTIGSTVTLIDYDGDGRLDMVFGAGGGQSLRLVHNQLPSPFVDVTNSLLPTMAATATTIDVDRDGRRDLLCMDAGGLRVFRFVAGAFVEETALRIQPPLFGNLPAVADIDADGWEDLVGRDAPVRRNQNGVFVPYVGWTPLSTAGATGQQVQASAFGDFDGDGDTDMIVGFGALRNRTRDLFVARPWRLGMQSELVLQAYGGDGIDPQFALLMLANEKANPALPLPGIGTLRLDPATLLLHSLHVFPGTGGEVSVLCHTPLMPGLLGTGFYTQALFLHRPSTGELRLSNLCEQRIRL